MEPVERTDACYLQYLEVLKTGRPSVLEGSEALQQFPAGMIKDIEIITNPSAKFDPEGTGGTINIITEKRKLTGLSGLIHAEISYLNTDGVFNRGNNRYSGRAGGRVVPG